MLRLRTTSFALVAGALALACSDSNQPVGPTDQSDGSNPPMTSRVASQGGPEDPVALGRTVPGFGGFFLDAQGNPTVYLKDAGRRGAAEQALAPWLGSHGLQGSQMRVLHADFDWAQLEDWHAKGSPVALAVRGAVYADADESTNRLKIGIERGASAGEVRQALARLGIPAAAVTVEETDPIIQLATLQSQVRPVVAGLQINFPGFLCSIGFNATRSGTAGFVTASHYTTGGACPAGRRCRRSDASFARYINSTTNTLGAIARTSSTHRNDLTIVGNWTITGEASSSTFAIGAVVNKVGRT